MLVCTFYVNLSKFGCQFLHAQKWLPISKTPCITPWLLHLIILKDMVFMKNYVSVYEINIVNDYFMTEICKRETMSKTLLSKYIAVFDYFGKTLLVFPGTIGRASIVSFATVINALVGITSTSLSLIFSISNASAKNF